LISLISLMKLTGCVDTISAPSKPCHVRRGYKGWTGVLLGGDM
jgi:hypothetical protein